MLAISEYAYDVIPVISHGFRSAEERWVGKKAMGADWGEAGREEKRDVGGKKF